MAGLGLIGTALAGGAVGYADYFKRSKLKEEEAAIQAQRDKTLQDFQQRMATERMSFESGQQTQRLGHEYDLAGARDDAAEARLDIQEEGADIRHEQTIGVQERNAAAQEAQADEQARHNKAVETIQSATAGSQAATAGLDRAIKQIQLDNAKRVKELQVEFRSASQERKKAINEEVQLITGKDNGAFLPVPLKDAEGNITGYKVFDKKRGDWVEQGGGAASNKTGWDNVTGEVFVSGKVVGKTKSEEEARKIAAGQNTGFTNVSSGLIESARAARTSTKKDPITGEQMTKQQMERKYGKGSFERAG